MSVNMADFLLCWLMITHCKSCEYFAMLTQIGIE